jgi:Ca2+-binding EF-hand superfamily protein
MTGKDDPMNAKKIALATLGAALIAGASIPAHAAPPPPGPAGEGRPGPDGMRGPGRGMMNELLFVRLLKSADANKDGKISKEEMTGWQDQMFTQIDANKDGFVTRGELLDYRTAKMEEFRKNNPDPKAEDADDNDGPDAAAMDDEADRGPRGPHGDRAERHGSDHHGKRDHDRREARNMAPRGPMSMGPRVFRMIDEDGDKKISKTEASAAADKLFAMLDTNKDGQITIDDLPDRPL